MAMTSVTTPETAPEMPPPCGTIEEIDRRVNDLKNQTSTLYFATLGVIEFTAGSCPNPGDFDGILSHARQAWQNASTLRDVWEGTLPVKEHAWGPAAFTDDDRAYQAWRKWWHAAGEAMRAAEISDEMGDSDAAPQASKDRARAEYQRLADIEAELTRAIEELPASPVGVAARLILALYRQGPVGALDGKNGRLQQDLCALLLALEPHVPSKMEAAVRNPFNLDADDGGAS